MGFDKTNPIRVVVIGGGISGIAQGIRLKEELGDKVAITILEKRSSPGGVWRDSKWAGAGVDVPIHLYQLGGELNPDWSTVYASQPEVLAYWEGLVDKHDLRDNFLFNSEYIGSEWNSDSQTHTVFVQNVQTGNKLKLEAEVLVSAAGPLAKPQFPNIPGVKSFAGPYFHNLRWDSDVKLEGKRVAVIGNGSSGIQLVPGVAALPGVTLTHYIRSGGYFVPKPQRNYTAFERFAFNWIPGVQHAYRLYLLYLHDQTWSTRHVYDSSGSSAEEVFLLDYLKKTAPAEYLDALTPHYPLGSKRTALNLGWLETLHKDNVELTNTTITKVHPNGIETADGKLREHDVIIYATGSDVPYQGVGVNTNLHGEGGVELEQYWKSIGGPQAYAGVAVPHFPNYFIIIGPNGTAGSWGWTININTQAIARIVRELVDYGVSSVQPREAPFKAHNAKVQNYLKHSAAATKATNNWWRTDEGLITVVNPQAGLAEWWSKLSTKWSDWDAVKAVKGPDGKTRLQKVDVNGIKRRRRVLKLAVVGAVSAATYYNWNGIVDFVTKESGELRKYIQG
ncbi:hypothetical protein Q8F55_007301 [Vanrija albida]|uniref:FAD/NAD(P)-binding domain-containing protein n=1 Tax=Vanrija albida TaxID=181172 RepID=A0ABR3PZD6_9TREE